MGTLKDPNSSSEGQKLMNKVLIGLVNQLEAQQAQILYLADRIKLQHDQRVSDANLFQEKISQMARDFAVQEMERMVNATKSDLLMGLKQREAFIYKLKLEHADSELEDFKEWFDLLSRKCSEPKDIPKAVNKKGEDKLFMAAESELRTLKYENEKLISRNSALSSETDFVWNQYKEMESNLTDQLRCKNAEVEQGNEKIQKLLTNMEQLQSSIAEKDDTIITLKTNMANLESDSLKKTEEISRLSRELELLRRSRSDSLTPVLRRCTTEKGASQLGGKNSGVNGRIISVKKDSSQEVLEKGSRNSKRDAIDTTSISETPKLFSSRFKVPKLKSSSPSVI